MKEKSLKIFCDGGARGNPGPAASAFVVIEEGEVVASGSKYLGKKTNNFAEYWAVVMALTWLTKNDNDRKTTFVLDSQLVTKQLNGEYKVKNENLRPLVLKVKKLERELTGEIVYTWSARANNKLADSLVNKELDQNI